MAEERMSDLGVIARHYNERISVDEVFLEFSQTHSEDFFNHYFTLTRIIILLFSPKVGAVWVWQFS